MKLLLENWRKHLLKEAQVKFSGILKLMPDPDVTAEAIRLQRQIIEQDPEMVPLPEDKLHVTLAHQSVLKPFRKILKNMELPPPPSVSLNSEIKIAVEGDKKSYFVEVNEQEELRNYINEVMTMAGGAPDPEPGRIFHISLTNRTGNPGDSIAYTWEFMK
jgi:hypothetical protein